jgi:hypothetical protein
MQHQGYYWAHNKNAHFGNIKFHHRYFLGTWIHQMTKEPWSPKSKGVHIFWSNSIHLQNRSTKWKAEGVKTRRCRSLSKTQWYLIIYTKCCTFCFCFTRCLLVRQGRCQLFRTRLTHHSGMIPMKTEFTSTTGTPISLNSRLQSSLCCLVTCS